jgi:mannobiose 2-epimerase
MRGLCLLPVLVFTLLSCCSKSPPDHPGRGAVEQKAQRVEARLLRIQTRLDKLAMDDWAFWKAHGPDREHGGFHGTLDRRGNPIPPTDKGLIQTARHLWSTSLWYEKKERTPEVKALSDDLYRFLMKRFYDGGAGEFHFKVSRSGEPVETKKVLYANAFAIYALTQYARAYEVSEAGLIAHACFRALDARAHDVKFGGYDQRNDPAWLSPGAEKETNTHLHLMEAFSSLYAYGKDPVVKERLGELIQLFTTKILQKEGYARKEFLLDWSPFGEPAVSYGHDIETAWLLVEAAESFGQPDEPTILKAALTLGSNSAEWGYDSKHGGFFEEGIPAGTPVKREKIWWIQAEALPGLYELHRLSKDAKHLDRLEKTLDFIEAHQVDREFGGWYWGALEDGRLGPRGDNKGEEWKASYHELRALVLTSEWITRRR